MSSHPRELWLRQSVLTGLTEALSEESHNEICGVLIGTVHIGIGTAEDFYILTNTDSQPGWFGILDSDINRVKRYAQSQHMDLVAVFHNHKSGNLDLSLPDKAALRESDLPWLVCTNNPSSSGLIMRAYAPQECNNISIKVLDY